MDNKVGDLDQLQIERENLALTNGYKRYLRAKADELKQDYGNTYAGMKVLPLLLPMVRDHLRTLVDTEAAPGRGRKADWFTDIVDLDLDLVAAEAVRSGLHLAMQMKPLNLALERLGECVEAIHHSEALIAKLGKRKGAERIAQVVRDTDSVAHRARAVRKLAGTKEWDKLRRVKAGEPLLNALLLAEVNGEPVFERETLRIGHDRTETYLILSEQAERLVDEIDMQAGWLRPSFAPMVVEPTPWTSFTTGAYKTKAMSTLVPLVRRATPEMRKAITAAIKDGSMQAVLDAVNRIQSVPLEIDGFMVDLAEWAFNNRKDIKKFPTRNKAVVPPMPDDFAERTPAEKRRIFERITNAKRINRGRMANAVAFRTDVEAARELVGLPVYLPHNMDRRGRVYPVSALSHHRADYVKSWFRFRNRVKLGRQGWYWLRVHLANVAGMESRWGRKTDKLPFDLRVQWVEENHDLFMRVAEDPKAAFDLWKDADKPFQFVAACREYAEAFLWGDPTQYASGLVCDLDGSNSGVQHYSAALRAEEGVYVNLVPSDEPNDLYAVVAREVAAHAAEDAKALPAIIADPRSVVANVAAEARENADDKDHPSHALLKAICASIWTTRGIKRSDVKRNVMTFAYSSEAFGFRDQLMADLMEPLAVDVMDGKLEAHPFGDDDGRACATYLAKLVYRAVTELLPKAAAGMRFLQVVAGALAHEKKGVWWKTADGLPVHQCYREPDIKMVNLRLYNADVKVGEHTPNDRPYDNRRVLARFRASVAFRSTDVVQKHQQRSAIAPNVIHSADACHLRMVVNAAWEQGITDMMLVHDSFGCHAAYLGLFGQIIRDTMVEMYNTWCPFRSVYEHALADLSDDGRKRLAEHDHGSPPERGSLDLEEIRQATYAFS